MSFNENSRVKIPALLHLCRLGYVYLPLPGTTRDESTNIFIDIFAESIGRINPELEEGEIRRALEDISLALDNEDLGEAFYRMLTARSGVKLLDFDDVNNNSFHVVTELPYKNGDDLFRPDITLLINGMPLAFIEVKKPNNHGGILEERDRMKKRFRNKKFRKFINISQLLIFSNNMEYDQESIEPIQGAFYATTSQDISQKSSSMLRLNLILNNLVHSIQNIIQGNTMLAPYHKSGDKLMTFDYIVSNPPFKLDFSDYHADLDTKQNHNRFFAGIPKVTPKSPDKMAIYLLFIQHIIFSLSPKGKAAIVVPTGFITAQSGIERKIREKLVEKKMLRGVVSMPSNIFATTGTNVSVLFLDKGNSKGDIVLMDASKLGTTVKDGKNQKTLLSAEEEELIITTFNNHKPRVQINHPQQGIFSPVRLLYGEKLNRYNHPVLFRLNLQGSFRFRIEDGTCQFTT